MLILVCLSSRKIKHIPKKNITISQISHFLTFRIYFLLICKVEKQQKGFGSSAVHVEILARELCKAHPKIIWQVSIIVVCLSICLSFCILVTDVLNSLLPLHCFNLSRTSQSQRKEIGKASLFHPLMVYTPLQTLCMPLTEHDSYVSYILQAPTPLGARKVKVKIGPLPF